MTLKGGATPSCAACKYRRRKCTATCPLAPYFPADKPKMFQNVHRLFGVSNVTKTLESLETKEQKDDAMKSIIYEAEIRVQIPVYGCPFIIRQLSFQLQVAREELSRVYSQIAACKEQQQSNQRMDHNSCRWPSSHHESGTICTPCINSQDVEGMESIPFRFFLNEDAENLDSTSSYTLFSTHFQKEPEILAQDHGGQRNNTTADESLQKEPEIFVQDYGCLRYNTTADDIKKHANQESLLNDPLVEMVYATSRMLQQAAGYYTVNHNEELGFEFWDQIFHLLSSK